MKLSFTSLASRIRAGRDNAPTEAYVNKDELIRLRDYALARDHSTNIPSTQHYVGQTRSRQFGSGVEFTGMRAYEPGDDIRHISWRLSARTGKPLTKLYTEDRQMPIYIVVDQRSEMFFGSSVAFKSVVAARVAALVGWGAVKKNVNLGGMIIGQDIFRINVKHSRKAILNWLDTIVSVNNSLSKESQTVLSLQESLLACRAYVTPGSRIVIISDFSDFDSVSESVMQHLSKRNSLSLVRVSDTLEDSLPLLRAVGVSDGRQTKAVVLSAGVRDQHDKERMRLLEHLQSCAIQCRSALSCINQTDLNLSTLLESLEIGIARSY